jgi:hypothetical protein
MASTHIDNFTIMLPYISITYIDTFGQIPMLIFKGITFSCLYVLLAWDVFIYELMTLLWVSCVMLVELKAAQHHVVRGCGYIAVFKHL